MKKWKKILISVIFAVFVTIGFADAYFTDYSSKSISAQSGVALELSGDAGIASMSQPNALKQKGNTGWYKKGATAKATATVKNGYTFDGWYNGSTKVSSSTTYSPVMNGYTKLQAKSQATTYSIIYYSDGKPLYSNGHLVSFPYTTENEYPLKTAEELGLKKDGYKFVGWYDNEQLTGTVCTSVPKGSTMDKIFYAKWERLEPILQTGKKFNSNIPSGITSVIFTGEPVPDGVDAIDVSEFQNGSVKAWLEGETFYVSSMQSDKKVIANADSVDMFSGSSNLSGNLNCQNLRYIDVEFLNTARMVNAERMFISTGRNAPTFYIMGLNDWDMSSCTNTRYMFNGAGYNATMFDIGNIGNWDMSNVIYADYMLGGAGYNTTTFDIGNIGHWDMSNVTNASHMLSGAGYNATTWYIGNIGDWDMSSCTDTSYMLNGAGYNATTFHIGDIGHWDMSNVTDASHMLSVAGYNATTFHIGDIGHWDMSSVTNASHMLYAAGYSATTFDIGNIGHWDMSSCTDTSYMLYAAGYKATVWDIGDISDWDMSNIIHADYMLYCAGGHAAWDYKCINLFWNLLNVESANGMFQSCSGLNGNIMISGKLKNYTNMFYRADPSPGHRFVVHYTSDASDIVDAVVATNTSGSILTGTLVDKSGNFLSSYSVLATEPEVEQQTESQQNEMHPAESQNEQQIEMQQNEPQAEQNEPQTGQENPSLTEPQSSEPSEPDLDKSLNKDSNKDSNKTEWKIGDHVTAVLSDGVLKISGTGETYVYQALEEVPWDAYRDEITAIEVDDSVCVTDTQYWFEGCREGLEVSALQLAA